MKTIKFYVATLLLLFLGFSGNLSAQAEDFHTVNIAIGEAALLEVINDVDLTYGGGASVAGAEIDTEQEPDVSSRIHISSLLADGLKRKIVVGINQSPNLNSGVNLFVQALEPNASYTNLVATLPEGVSYKWGNLEPEINLDDAIGGGNAAKTLVSGIFGTCWTGTGDDDGYVLQYRMTQFGTSAFVEDSYTVTYTMMADE